jgi:uncharacterized protein YbjT (DUF2867 family)
VALKALKLIFLASVVIFMEKAKVLVAGATGYLGKYVIEALHREGYRIRALARNAERLGEVKVLCDEIVVAETTKPKTLTKLIGDATVVFSSLGKHDFKRKPTLLDVDYKANMNILRRAIEAKVEHFVFISALHSEQLKSKGVRLSQARERVVEALQESGLNWTVLRPTGFFNDMADLFNMAVKGTGWVAGNGYSRMNPIHGADLADKVVQCIADPDARNKAFTVGGPDVLTQREMYGLAFGVLKKEMKVRYIPLWMLRPMSKLLGLFIPMAGDAFHYLYYLVKWEGLAPACGTRHLKDFYQELARTTNT